MKDLKYIVVILFLFTAGLLTYRVTLSYFSDLGTSSGNVLSASAVFPSLTPTPTLTGVPTLADHLVINEVLYDTSSAQNITGQGGSNRGEFVEIYNPTGSSVNLTGWTIEDNTSSETLSGTLISGGRLIITGGTEAEFESIWSVSDSTIYIQGDDGTIGNGLANGGDNLILKNGITEIDKMSWGTNITGFSSGCGATCPTTPSGQSFERNSAGLDTNASGDFTPRNPPTPGS